MIPKKKKKEKEKRRIQKFRSEKWVKFEIQKCNSVVEVSLEWKWKNKE